MRSSSEYTNTNDDGSTERERQTTAERYTGSVGSALQLGEHRQLTATGRYEHDDFATYDRLATFGIGYGTRLINADRFIWMHRWARVSAARTTATKIATRPA